MDTLVSSQRIVILRRCYILIMHTTKSIRVALVPYFRRLMIAPAGGNGILLPNHGSHETLYSLLVEAKFSKASNLRLFLYRILPVIESFQVHRICPLRKAIKPYYREWQVPNGCRPTCPQQMESPGLWTTLPSLIFLSKTHGRPSS